MANIEEKQLLKIISNSNSTTTTTTTTVTKRIKSASTKKNKKLKECAKMSEIVTEKSFETETIEKQLQAQQNSSEEIKSELNDEKNLTNQQKVNEKKIKKHSKSSSSEIVGKNISVKSGLNKFDALQKKNSMNNLQCEKTLNCRLCSKPVYKMEEIKAEKSIYHKPCFRCQECKKQLSVDNYQSHEGVLFCIIHFKSLFSPKGAEQMLVDKPLKPELIIRENQPAELPPDVVRASDKPSLGLEELSQLNVRQRFQIFEGGQELNHEEKTIEHNTKSNNNNSNSVLKKSFILSKLAKLEAHGFDKGNNIKNFNENPMQLDNSDDDTDEFDIVKDKFTQNECERIVGLSEDVMQDIKSKFESGHMISKEERRVERKQEIQNIRSRLFMGKQAKIKEQYQQAVAESEQGITSAQKISEIDCEVAAKDIKNRFETGELFIRTNSNSTAITQEADVFESAISKKSRSIFKELDANSALINNQIPQKVMNATKKENANKISLNDVIKYDENVDEVKVATAEISEKFKFFETYRPQKHTKKAFSITPPRDETTTEIATPELESNSRINDDDRGSDNEKKTLEKSHTTSKMLCKFREMEKQQQNNNTNNGPKPLKSFTPPPDGGHRKFIDTESDYSSEEEIENEEYEYQTKQIDDDALIEAKAAARAKQLRAKFEKWETEQIKNEQIEGNTNNLTSLVSGEEQIESTKLLRERFENMKYSTNETSNKPRHQINRFV